MFPDFYLYEAMDVHKMFHPSCLDDFPKLQAFVQRFEVRFRWYTAIIISLKSAWSDETVTKIHIMFIICQYGLYSKQVLHIAFQ